LKYVYTVSGGDIGKLWIHSPEGLGVGVALFWGNPVQSDLVSVVLNATTNSVGPPLSSVTRMVVNIVDMVSHEAGIVLVEVLEVLEGVELLDVPLEMQGCKNWLNIPSR